ncbi:nSTAND3 domain-containing NTPase [Burkholderia cenocepacia]|uniref:nSTAND3 domain-containing NTPase n=1 Tax=Burkholderia cenocepacia TaxID=95486 RepID=UPI002B248B18|nr:restriction endonuclease [Burkholderia cenocepacia]MEB2545744.1 restriction endonuclease [Burkholderia cenocepacia]
MTNYDFRSLNDKEFEVLCVDLIGAVVGHRIERFKPGRDSGVDGRFFASPGEEVILQCKHWINTPIRELIRVLKVSEKEKLKRLRPARYLLAISNPLSRLEKASISEALSPYVSQEDIFGQEDLNDMLRSNPLIERRHYKLWLHSAAVLDQVVNHAVLGRSEFSLSEIITSSAFYAVTQNHQRALDMLERLNVAIITGEPGVGKTTLANHLCLHYVTHGYEFIKIADEIREAENVFRDDAKQVFYFDDFLGRNYLDALRGHEGSQIGQFIRRVARDGRKRFVLTSRSTILNQGKFLLDSYYHDNLERNEYELRIASLSELDKANILYNHLWHSGLPGEFVDELYQNKRYKVIIGHQNFNPRLISYITDYTRLEGVASADYWSYIVRSIANPSQIWGNPFLVQQDDFGRSIVMLIVFNGREINESDLANAYQHFICLPENRGLQGRREFQSNVRLLTGSFVNRIVSPGGEVRLDLFNPSIGDFVLRRYANDLPVVKSLMVALRSYVSIGTLESAERSNWVDSGFVQDALVHILSIASQEGFVGFSVDYLSAVSVRLLDVVSSNVKIFNLLADVSRLVCSSNETTGTLESLSLVTWAVNQRLVAKESAASFLEFCVDMTSEYGELVAMSALAAVLAKESQVDLPVVDKAHQQVVDAYVDRFDELIDTAQVFGSIGYQDYDSAYDKLYSLLERELSNYGLVFDGSDLEIIMDSFDVEDELDKFQESSYEPDDDDSRRDAPAGLTFDAIDDLFDRS